MKIFASLQKVLYPATSDLHYVLPINFWRMLLRKKSTWHCVPCGTLRILRHFLFTEIVPSWNSLLSCLVPVSCHLFTSKAQKNLLAGTAWWQTNQWLSFCCWHAWQGMWLSDVRFFLGWIYWSSLPRTFKAFPCVLRYMENGLLLKVPQKLSYSFLLVISVFTGSCMIIMSLFFLSANFCQISFLIPMYIK